MDNENLENNAENVESTEKSTTDILPVDYYDTYYNKVIDNLTSINEKQQTIIYNQEQIQLSVNDQFDNLHNKIDNLQNGIDVLVFLAGLSLIYTLIRNMLHR